MRGIPEIMVCEMLMSMVSTGAPVHQTFQALRDTRKAG